jgi:TolA-binding protein
MKLQLILGSVALMTTLSSCVTTRAQLNEKRVTQGSDLDASSPAVQSESLNGEEVASETKTGPSAEPIVAAPPASQYGMEEMRAELARLSGKVEEMEHEKKNQQASQQEEQQKLLAKIAELEKQLKQKEEQQNGPSVPEGKTPFQAAKEAFSNAKYAEAIEFFTVFMEQPNTKEKDLAEATFLRGESHFRLKDYKKAIIDYSRFPEAFQKSNFHPKALLKLAQSFEALDMKDDAHAFYQDLFQKFPKTAEGMLAKKKLSGKSAKR